MRFGFAEYFLASSLPHLVGTLNNQNKEENDYLFYHNYEIAHIHCTFSTTMKRAGSE